MDEQQTPEGGQQNTEEPTPATPATPPPPSPEGATPKKADLVKRLIAAIIDALITVVISLIPVVGGLIALAYWLFRDGLDIDFMDHRSLGKKLLKIRPQSLDGSPVDIMTSIKRNWMFAIFGLASALAWIPILGWLAAMFLVVIGAFLLLIEIVLVLVDDQGRRMGDKIANTRIVETAD